MTVKDIHLAAADWMERRLRPEWSAADQAALDSWLTEPGNMVAYLRAEAAWNRAERLVALRETPAGPMRPQKHPAQSNLWPLLRRTAAGVVFAALVGTIAWQQMGAPAEATYATAIGEHKAITFKDGTRIELNTDTVLRISQKSGERKVWLDRGEAYFEVEHDAARPFIVFAQGRKITDLGTKFTVRQDVDGQHADRLHVAVVEGLVEVAAKDRQPQSLLKPGDVLVATQKAQTVSRKPLRSLIAGLNWKNGQLILEDATLAEAVAEFNRYNSRKLVLADPGAAKLTITGTFQTRNLDTFTKVAKDIFGFKAEKTDDQIILSR